MAQSSQDDLLDFLNDPETIKRAVEGSMEKRLKVMAQSNGDEELRDRIDTILSHFEVTVPGVGDVGLFDLVHPRIKDEYGNGVEWALVMNEELMQLILANRKQHELELLDRLAEQQEDLFWWTGGEYEKTKGIDMRAIAAERERLGK